MVSRRSGRRGWLRALLAGTAAAVLATTGAVSATAEVVDPTTTITGTVTREDDGAPVSMVRVFVANADFTQTGVGSTDANGEYTVPGLAPGEYTVRFAADGVEGGLLGEYWDGARTVDAAQRVTAVGGETIADIDASLQASATIDGRVTRERDGTPVSGVSVLVAPENTRGASAVTVTTDDDGRYRADGLVPGSYTIAFDTADEALADQYWQGAYSRESATRVALAAGQVVEGIDAALSVAIGFEGTVTRASDGTPAPGYVEILSPGVAVPAYWTPIADDGSYRVTVAPGVYYVRFVSSDPRLLPEYVENVYRLEDATPAVVAANGGMFSFSAQLETGRAISGVVRADGEPLADAIVETLMYGAPAGGMAYTDQDGRYEIIVPPGDYTVRAFGTSEDPTYAWQYFDGVDAPSQATEIALGTSADRTGVDFDLSKGGTIRGSISADDGEVDPAGAEVTAYLWSEGEWTSVASQNTRGEFSLGAWADGPAPEGGLLPAGTYTLGIGAEGYCPTFLGGGTDVADAETFELAGGEVVTDLALTLTADCDTTPPVLTPTLSLGAGSVRAGSDITVAGTGFAPGEVIAFELRSDPIALGALTADAQGALQGSFRIPASAPAGSHTLVALNAQSEVVASVALQVTAASGQGDSGSGSGTGSGTGGPLATTGSEVPVAAVLTALTLLTLGVLMVRRRRIES